MSAFLITGGAGFIGRHLCRELLGLGHRVRVLDSLIDQAHGPQAAPMPPEVELVRADVRDEEAVARSLKGIDGVFHLAAEVGVGQSMYEIERYVSANDLGTAVLMQQLIGSGIRRIVVASSMSLYGEGLYLDPEGRPVEAARRSPAALRAGAWEPRGARESRSCRRRRRKERPPTSPPIYALTKFDQEQMVLMLAGAYGIEGVALRLFNTYGPGQTLSNPYTGVLAIFAGRLLNGEAPLVFEDGNQQRDLVHVEDVARAFHLAMVTPDIAGEVFNIGERPASKRSGRGRARGRGDGPRGSAAADPREVAGRRRPSLLCRHRQGTRAPGLRAQAHARGIDAGARVLGLPAAGEGQGAARSSGARGAGARAMSDRLREPAAAFGLTEWFRQGEHERVLAASRPSRGAGCHGGCAPTSPGPSTTARAARAGTTGSCRRWRAGSRSCRASTTRRPRCRAPARPRGRRAGRAIWPTSSITCWTATAVISRMSSSGTSPTTCSTGTGAPTRTGTSSPR